MAREKTVEKEFDDWMDLVAGEGRRRALLARSIETQRTGPFSAAIKFYFKLFEIGPVETVKLAWLVVSTRIRNR